MGNGTPRLSRRFLKNILCVHSAAGKESKKPLSPSKRGTTRLLERFLLDITENMSTASLARGGFAVGFLDDSTAELDFTFLVQNELHSSQRY